MPLLPGGWCLHGAMIPWRGQAVAGGFKQYREQAAALEKDATMETNVFITVFFPFVLAFIMFGIGLSLVVDDFKRILVYPKAVGLGLAGQLVVVPLVGFMIASRQPFRLHHLSLRLAS
jgi:hypothetical protein